MRSVPYLGLMIFSIIIFAIDFYSFKGLRKIKIELNKRTKTLLHFLFWAIPALVIIALIVLVKFRESVDPKFGMLYFHFFSGVFLLFYIPKVIFIFFNLLDDFYHLVKYIFEKAKHIKRGRNGGVEISRSTFLTRIGVLIAGIPFLSIIYGIVWGRYNFIVRKTNLGFHNLPTNFNGFKIAQISDFHLGSFGNDIEKVKEVVELVNLQSPDIIVFTGDFVNNLASEMEPFIAVLSKFKAKLGMFSILGNHDYGEYVKWESDEMKRKNLDKLIKIERGIGFKMLLNGSVKIKKGDESIALIGVENWGLPPFPQYGKLEKALTNVDDSEFKILLSHDPTHWDAKVVNKTNIDLTLSGHTHGAQFGIEIPGWRWSPVNLRYKQWGGIYKKNKQALNVNTGIGFIGFPGRIGMPPEVGLITLKKAVNL